MMSQRTMSTQRAPSIPAVVCGVIVAIACSYGYAVAPAAAKLNSVDADRMDKAFPQSPVNPRQQTPPSIYGRRIHVGGAITGSPRLRDGFNYEMVGRAAICGEIPKEASLTGQATFVIEVAGETTGTMTTITFGSRHLVGSVTQTTSFRLTVGVVNPSGGQPPLYVLNTDPPKNGNLGTATLTNAKGVMTLRIVGQNDQNERIELAVTCS